MLKKGDWMDIRALVEKGMYQKDIAEQLGVHPKTVRRALQRGGPPSGDRPNARYSKLDPFKGFIDELLHQDVWNVMVILQRTPGARLHRRRDDRQGLRPPETAFEGKQGHGPIRNATG